MASIDSNPLGILTFIVAPAILTNASSVMALGTSNRFARAIDRARQLIGEINKNPTDASPEGALRRRQLLAAERRVLLLVRALTSFYVSLGCFAAASLVSLLGAVFYVTQREQLHQIALMIALGVGAAGVLSIVCGSALLVWESRKALHILADEAKLVQKQYLATTHESE